MQSHVVVVVGVGGDKCKVCIYAPCNLKNMIPRLRIISLRSHIFFWAKMKKLCHFATDFKLDGRSSNLVVRNYISRACILVGGKGFYSTARVSTGKDRLNGT